MIIDTQVLQEKGKKILDAIGAKKGLVVDTLELEVANNALYMNVTDKEYFVSVKIPLESPEEFHAVVNASLFLSLITKITTKTTTMKTKDNALLIKGNGNYKLPLIFDGGSLVELPRINIENITNEFTIKNSILQSILKYNDKILYTGGCNFPVFYVDDSGAVTISHSACLNTFTLPQPVSLILSEKLVKLFKLFKSEDIQFSMGYDARADGAMQQKVLFFDGDVRLTAILITDDKLTKTFPVGAIRNRAERVAPYGVVIDKEALIEALDRLALFKDSIDLSVYVTFTLDDIKLTDSHKVNEETVDYINSCPTLPEEGYTAKFNVDDLSLILDTLDDKYLNISFGDKALTIVRDNIKYMLPECR